MIAFLSAIWLGLSMLFISNNETLAKISDKISVYPSEISNGRFNFLLLSCVTIPIGFILANVFLKLYFKFDGGYFTVLNIQFHYNKHQKLRETFSRYCMEKYNNMACCKCCKVTLLDPENMGDWVDMSSLEEEENDSLTDAMESDIENQLNLNQREKEVFETIKKSIPYYRR